MAAESGVPVIPCGIVGAHECAPAGARLPRPRKVGVRFGDPMPPVTLSGKAPTAEELRTWTDELMDRIAVLSGQEQSDLDQLAP